MVKKVDGSFVSILGATRESASWSIDKAQSWELPADVILDQSFSDFPLLSPGSPSFAMSLLQTTHELSDAFIHGQLATAPAIEGKKPDQGDFERTPEGKMAGRKGDVVVHLIGQEH